MDYPAFDIMLQSLPMVQAILLMTLIIAIQFVLLFACYNVKTVMTLTFVSFELNFMTFW